MFANLRTLESDVPRTKLVYYLEEDGTVPIIDWLAGLPRKATVKCLVYLARLESEGHELRRPIADTLRDGIHELRPSLAGVQYQILNFFHRSEEHTSELQPLRH